MTKRDLIRRAASSNESVAFPALVSLGYAQPVTPTTDSGWKSYGNGRLFLPAATNYCTNPNFVTDTDADGMADGISAAPANTTVTKSIVTRVVDGKAVKVQSVRVVGLAGVGVTIGADFDTTAVGSFATNDYGYASAYLKITELVGCTLRVQLVNRNAGGSALATTSSSAITAVDSDFVRRSVTAQLTHADTSRANVKIVTVANFEEGDSFTVEIAMAQLEKSAVLTPYGDGTYSDWSWTGVANASTSVRAASVLYGASPWATVPAAGTIAGRFVPLGANTVYGTEGLCGLYSTTTPLAEVCHSGGKHSMKVGAASTSTATFALGATLCSVGRWDAAGTYLHHNGAAAADGAAPTVGGAIDRLYLGIAGKYSVGPVVFSSTCLTAAEAVLLDTLIRGGGQGIDVFRFMRDRGYRDTWVYPLNGDSVGYLVT